MSLMSFKNHVCPKCNQNNDIETYDSINVDVNPELKEKILNYSLFDVECPVCGNKYTDDFSFLYSDPTNKLLIAYGLPVDIVNFYDIHKTSIENGELGDIVKAMQIRYFGVTDLFDLASVIHLVDHGYDAVYGFLFVTYLYYIKNFKVSTFFRVYTKDDLLFADYISDNINSIETYEIKKEQYDEFINLYGETLNKLNTIGLNQMYSNYVIMMMLCDKLDDGNFGLFDKNNAYDKTIYVIEADVLGLVVCTKCNYLYTEPKVGDFVVVDQHESELYSGEIMFSYPINSFDEIVLNENELLIIKQNKKPKVKDVDDEDILLDALTFDENKDLKDYFTVSNSGFYAGYLNNKDLNKPPLDLDSNGRVKLYTNIAYVDGDKDYEYNNYLMKDIARKIIENGNYVNEIIINKGYGDIILSFDDITELYFSYTMRRREKMKELVDFAYKSPLFQRLHRNFLYAKRVYDDHMTVEQIAKKYRSSTKNIQKKLDEAYLEIKNFLFCNDMEL